MSCVCAGKRFGFALWLASLLVLGSLTIFNATALEKGSGAGAIRAAGVGTPYVYLRDGYDLKIDVAQLVDRSANEIQPLRMATADFDGDGVVDLVAGYAVSTGGLLALVRGNPEAFAPRSPESFQQIAAGSFPEPFLQEGRVMELAERPDFLWTADFNRDGHPDVVTAARGGSNLYLLTGDGRGALGAPQQIALPWQITALTAGEINRRDGLTDAALGLVGPDGPVLVTLEGAAGSAPAIYILPAEATALAMGQLDDDDLSDLVVVAGGDVYILHGRDPNSVAGGAAVLEAVPFPFKVQALAVAPLIWDRDGRLEMALLAADGTLHLATRGDLDRRPPTFGEIVSRIRERSRQPLMRAQLDLLSRALQQRGYNPSAAPGAPPMRRSQSWQVVESYSLGAASAGPSALAQILAATLSGRSTQDVLVLDPAHQKLHLVFGETEPSAAGPQERPAPVSFQVGSAPIAGLAIRLNATTRPGIVLMREGQLGLTVAPAAPRAVFSVTRFDDPVPDGCAMADCSLREAVIDSTASAGPDVIMLPAGTYELTLGPGDDDATGDPMPHEASGDLDVCSSIFAGFLCLGGSDDNDLTVIGGGAGATIDSGGAGPSIDRIFDVDPVFGGGSLSLSLSNLTLRDGLAVAPSGAGGDGGAIRFLGGDFMSLPGSVFGGLTLIDCTLDHNRADAAMGGAGGAINLVFGKLAMTNTMVSNNEAASAVGGGILYDGGGTGDATLSISNSNFSGNHALDSTFGFGSGGGIFITGTSPFAPGATIGATDFTMNEAEVDGGGIANASSETVAVSGGSISANTAAGNGGGVANVGGSITITGATFSGNSATSGGALYAGGGTLIANLNRLVSNIGSGSGIARTGGTASVENNWWGCDGFPNAPGCETGTGTFDADPRLDLRLLPMPSSVLPGGMSTLKADFTENSAGAAVAPTVLEGLTVSFTSDALGSVSPGSNSISGAMATTTYTAGGTGGLSTVTATLDNGTEMAQITIQEPPSIDCPDDVMVDNDPAMCSAVVSYPAPTATGFPVPTVSCSQASGTAFPVGETTVTCMATSDAGSDSCDFMVTVNDVELPVIGACPMDIMVTEAPPGSGSAQVFYSEPTATDNCPAPVTCSTPSGSLFPVGMTEVTCTADDGTNTDSCSFNVTVEAPCAITCPADQLFPNDPGLCGANVSYPAPTTTGDCGAVTCVEPPGSFFDVGTSTVTCTTEAGPECSFMLTVEDNEPPVLTCSTAVTSMWPTNHVLINVGLTAAGSENCPDPAVAIEVFSDEDDEQDGAHSPDAKDIGFNTLRLRSERQGDLDGRVYLIIVRATDTASNESVCCRTVTVPKSQSQANLASVAQQAAAAQAHCEAFGAEPPEYVVVGDGPILGPNQ